MEPRNPSVAVVGAGDDIGSAIARRFAMRPASIADAYWQLHQQSRDAWTFELDLRPAGERW
jgi:NAD(P)-dependent dehydrogenase (short-subunit alcohol dehydrogenase family)